MDPSVTPSRRPRSPPEPSTIVLVLSGPIAPATVRGLCERVGTLLESSDADLIICDAGAVAEPDAVTVDTLARLQLTARRLGRHVRLSHACQELQALLALAGLSDVVPLHPELRLESGGQAEQREPASGVEEEADPTDPIA